MADENDKTDNKVPRFDNQNKSVSRDTRIKTYIQAFKCESLVAPAFLKIVEENEEEA
jgi:hypothetical protein